jgi:dATP/dGTP diphosphohydrolase, N-terminal
VKIKKVYLAACYPRHIELQDYAHELEAHGFIVNARWVWGNHSVDGSITDTANALKAEQFAQEDYDDVMDCDVFISFSERGAPASITGGRHVELGIMLGRIAGGEKVRIVIVGGRENIFHMLPPAFVEHYDTFDEALAHLIAQELRDWEPGTLNPKDSIGCRKAPLGMLPTVGMIYGSLGMHEGALKYGSNNFNESPVNASVYIDAIERHLQKYKTGQDVDPTSWVPHLGSIIAGASILLDAEAHGTLVDDRALHLNSAGVFQTFDDAERILERLHELYGQDTRPLRVREKYGLADK